MECVRTELDLFSKRLYSNQILETREIQINPTNSLEHSDSIEFNYLGSEKYVDLSSSVLVLRVSLVKDPAGAAYTEDVPVVSVINNLAASLFSSLSIECNGRVVQLSDTHFALKSYISNLFNFGGEAATNHLESSGWVLDKPNEFDLEMGAAGASGTVPTNKEGGWYKRAELFKKSKQIEIAFNISSDLMNCYKMLMGNIDLKLTFKRAPPEYYILSNQKDCKANIKIHAACLYLNVCTINPETLMAHQSVLAKDNYARLPLKRTEVREFTINSSGATHIQIPCIYSG